MLDYANLKFAYKQDFPLDMLSFDLPLPKEITGAFNDEEDPDFDESVQENQFDPIIIGHCDPNYLLLAGRRRVSALKKGGKKTAQAKIYEINNNPVCIASIFLHSNILRRNVIKSSYEVVVALTKLKEMKNGLGKTAAPVRLEDQEINDLPFSQATKVKLKKIEKNLIPELLSLYLNKTLNQNMAYVLSCLEKKYQEEIFKVCNNDFEKSKKYLLTIKQLSEENKRLTSNLEIMNSLHSCPENSPAEPREDYINELENELEKKGRELESTLKELKKYHSESPMKNTIFEDKLIPRFLELYKNELLPIPTAISIQAMSIKEQEKLFSSIKETGKETTPQINEILCDNAAQQAMILFNVLNRAFVSLVTYLKDDAGSLAILQDPQLMADFLLKINPGVEKFKKTFSDLEKNMKILREKYK